MKRSEIVLIIAESLIEPHFPDDIMKEASYILKRLERKGMTPPIWIEKYESTDFIGRDETKTVERKGWEPEDG